MQRFHRGIFVDPAGPLANLILGVEILRTNGFYSRSLLVILLIFFCSIGMYLSSALLPAMRHS